MLRPAHTLLRDSYRHEASPASSAGIRKSKVETFEDSCVKENKMVFIVAVHMIGGTGHEHIEAVRWKNQADITSGNSTREQVVTWIRDGKGEARVSDGRTEINVGVVNTTPPHIRTYADGKWSDNLLSLPRY